MDSASVAESGTSSPGSRFKVDVASDPAGTMSPGSRKGDPSNPTPPPPLSPPAYDGVAEVWFDSIESLMAGMSSPEGRFFPGLWSSWTRRCASRRAIPVSS